MRHNMRWRVSDKLLENVCNKGEYCLAWRWILHLNLESIVFDACEQQNKANIQSELLEEEVNGDFND